MFQKTKYDTQELVKFAAPLIKLYSPARSRLKSEKGLSFNSAIKTEWTFWTTEHILTPVHCKRGHVTLT
jgi:hypothetical protein